MEITDIRIRKVNAKGNLKAYARITFDDCFVVHNLKLISGKSGMFIAMPSRKTSNGAFKDIVHPINREFRQKLQDAIITAFNNPDAADNYEDEELVREEDEVQVGVEE
jgi:stage V sporulation protein G